MVADDPREGGGARLFPGGGRDRRAFLAVPPRRCDRKPHRRFELVYARCLRMTVPVTTYVELQVTSHFSFLRGASAPEELFASAALLGHSALGLCDRGSVAGMVRGLSGQEATGVRLIPGSRVDLRAGRSLLLYPTRSEEH